MNYMIGRATTLLALGIASTLLACTQRAYSGPALAASEVGVLKLSSTRVSKLSGLKVQGHAASAFSHSIEVIPGTQEIKFAYRRESIRCATLQEWCDVFSSRGDCQGSLETKAGKTYSISLEEAGHMLAAKVITEDSSSDRIPTIINCQEHSSRYTAERNPQILPRE